MNAQIKMRLITSKYRRYKFFHTASCTHIRIEAPLATSQGPVLAESVNTKLLGVTGRYWQQSSHSKNIKFNDT